MDNNNSSYQNSASYSSSFSLNPNANWSSMNANWSSNNPFSYNYNNSTNLSLEPQSPSRSSITDSNTHRNNNNYTHNQSIFSDQFFNSKSPLDSLPSNKPFDNSSINFNRLSCSNSQKLWPDLESPAPLAPDAHWGLVFPVQLGAGKSLAWPRQSPAASGPGQSLDHHYPHKSIRQFTPSIDNSPPFDYYAILAQKTVDKPDLNGFNSSSITNHSNHNHSTNNNNNSDNVLINPIDNDPTSPHDSSNQSPKSIIVRPANSQQSNPAPPPPSTIVATQSSAHLNIETLDRSLSAVGLGDHHHMIPVSVVVGPAPPSKKTWAVIVGKQQQQQQQQRHHNHQPQSSHSSYSPMRLPTAAAAAGPHLKPDFLTKKPLASADANPKCPAGGALDADCQNIKSGRFFVIKSYSEDDVYRSIKYRIWCSTETGNRRLDSAWAQSVSAAGTVPVYLFFSVNGSGHFCGVAEMAGPVDYKARASVWSQGKWKGQFPVRWLCVKDVPNSQLRHIRIETNENKPVTNSRDVTEIPLDKGRQVMKIIANFKASSSIYDDFDHYEQRELSESNQ